MAEKKSTTKTAAKTPAKKATKEVSLEQLRADLHMAQKSHKSGELVNPRVMKQYKKSIARLLTKQNQAKEEK